MYHDLQMSMAVLFIINETTNHYIWTFRILLSSNAIPLLAYCFTYHPPQQHSDILHQFPPRRVGDMISTVKPVLSEQWGNSQRPNLCDHRCQVFCLSASNITEKNYLPVRFPDHYVPNMRFFFFFFFFVCLFVFLFFLGGGVWQWGCMSVSNHRRAIGCLSWGFGRLWDIKISTKFIY